MPSWNIHIAHAERLLSEEGAAALGITDANAFVFGNLVPDIPVGHIVKDPCVHVEYRTTHLVDPQHIPLPDADRFWRRYIAQGEPNDVTLGAWAHLMCDNVYNSLTRVRIAELGMKPSTEVRRAKQRDFALFGDTLDICGEIEADGALFAQAAAYPQFELAEADVRAAIAAAHETGLRSRRGKPSSVPAYELLTPEFFEKAFAEAQRRCSDALKGRAAG